MYVFGKILDGAKSCVTIWKKLHVGLFLFCLLTAIATGSTDGAIMTSERVIPHIIHLFLLLSLITCFFKESFCSAPWSRDPWSVFLGWFIGSVIGSIIFIACFNMMQQFAYTSLVFLPCFWTAEVCLLALHNHFAPVMKYYAY